MKDAEASAIAHVGRPIDGRHEDLARDECRNGYQPQDEGGGPIDGGCQRGATEGAPYDEDVKVREGAAEERACRISGEGAEQERGEAKRVQDHPAEKEGGQEDSRLREHRSQPQ